MWLLSIAASGIWAAVKKWRRAGAADWPVTLGTITATHVALPKTSFLAQPKNQQGYKAELYYSYSVQGGSHSGCYKCDFPTEAESREFIRDLSGKRVRVHYHPDKVQKSFISMEVIQSLLQSRAPRLGNDPLLPFSPPLPAWSRPFIWVFVGLSAFGLLLSLWVHLNAVSGRQVLPGGFMALHAGIFVVWFPAVFAAQRLANQKPFSWEAVLRGAPAWMRYMAYAFCAYAMINFLFFFMAQASNRGSGIQISATTWRGFSGHWMAFYSMALAILFSAARIQDTRVRCAKGHLVSDTAPFCAECGRPATPS